MVTPTFAAQNLISTLDKRETLAMLRLWRREAESKDEADLLAELIERIVNGELDG